MDFSGRGGVSVIGVVGEKHDIFKTREETQMNHNSAFAEVSQNLSRGMEEEGKRTQKYSHNKY